jgi:hypothetical protein
MAHQAKTSGLRNKALAMVTRWRFPDNWRDTPFKPFSLKGNQIIHPFRMSGFFNGRLPAIPFPRLAMEISDAPGK